MGATSFHQNEIGKPIQSKNVLHFKNLDTSPQCWNYQYHAIKSPKQNSHPACVEVWNKHPGASANVLVSYSQASNLGQGISAANAEIPKMMFSFQKLNDSPRILIEPLHLQRANFQPRPPGELPVKTSRLVRHPSLCQPDKPPDATGLAQPKNRKTIILRNLTIAQPLQPNFHF